MVDISVVVPVYGCPEALRPLYERVRETMDRIQKSFELVLVNDACPKGSWKIIEELCHEDKRVMGIDLSRNFGQIHSTNAGIDEAKGEYIVLMDCDLQDRPEGIEDLFQEIEKGYDIVFARRMDRKDNAMVLFFSKTFYRIYNHFTEGYYDGDVGNFCIVRKKVVDEYRQIKDNNKSFTAMLSWMGYKVSKIDIEAEKRFEGKSSYTFSKKVDMAIDMLTSQSNKPLKAIIKLGFVIAALAFVYLVIQIINYFVSSNVTEGWTSIIAAIFLMGGITLVCLGGVGIYVGNIFSQTKGFPAYLIREKINGDKK
ncbi:MAG: glycosyltransferase [Erysipelotrichaceae bacterium]|nr:glycosyltransferase [Erysipelotrichaceae bacterium]